MWLIKCTIFRDNFANGKSMRRKMAFSKDQGSKILKYEMILLFSCFAVSVYTWLDLKKTEEKNAKYTAGVRLE